MNTIINKPKLIFFKFAQDQKRPEFMQLHEKQHIKCLANFFEVIVINQDCDYQQICDQYEPDITLFESGINYPVQHRINIKNINAYLDIPKLGFYNADSWTEARAGFISDMEYWGIETFFSISTTSAEYTPEIADNLFIWPNFIDADIYRDYAESKIIPVLFTGNLTELYPWRNRIKKIITEYYPAMVCPHFGYAGQAAWRITSGEQYARIINASWFVPTCGTIAKEVVRKIFEIPGSKSCLITEKTPMLEAAGFVDGKNCLFADKNDILDKLDYYFQNIEQLETIINAGYQFIHSQHTLQQRDQILQWFNLHKNLKANQKIIQSDPFKSLTIVEKSLEAKNLPILCHGLDLDILSQGDDKLWSSHYQEAETLYLKCLNYSYWLPEAKFRLALCNLYQGYSDKALNWILQPLDYTLNIYKAISPDPVEWAYFIISLLAQGKLEDANKYSAQYNTLRHPELDRIRWVVHFLTDKTINNISLELDQLSKYTYTIHQLPDWSLQDWLKKLVTILRSCKQFKLAKTLEKVTFITPNLPCQEPIKISLMGNEIPTFLVFLNHRKKLNSSNKIQPTKKFYYYNQKNLKKEIFLTLKMITKKYAQSLEDKLGYFLPYQFSQARMDEFCQFIQKILSTEAIKTVLVISDSASKISTQSFLIESRRNSNHSKIFHINIGSLQLQFFPFLKQNTDHIFTFSLHFQDTEKLKDVIINIKQANKFDYFDAVLVDFCGLVNLEFLESICQTKFIFLNDLNTYQNQAVYQKLILDNNYILVTKNLHLRNGFSIFKKIDLLKSKCLDQAMKNLII